MSRHLSLVLSALSCLLSFSTFFFIALSPTSDYLHSRPVDAVDRKKHILVSSSNSTGTSTEKNQPLSPAQGNAARSDALQLLSTRTANPTAAPVLTVTPTARTPSTTSQLSTTPPDWKCCIDPHLVNSDRSYANTSDVWMDSHNYVCRQRPTNFSWYWAPSLVSHTPLNRSKWATKNILILGGSTSRQMAEHLHWEFPELKPKVAALYTQYLYRIPNGWNNQGAAHYWYNHSHILDTQTLAPDIITALKHDPPPDLVIVNVGVWWSTKTIFQIIDEHGQTHAIDTNNGKEWITPNQTVDVSYATLMTRALTLLLQHKSNRTQLIWRSEGKTDCPVASTYRSSIVPVLSELKIPVLNVSEASCRFTERKLDEGYTKGPHTCYPSTILRYWLVKLQQEFL